MDDRSLDELMHDEEYIKKHFNRFTYAFTDVNVCSMCMYREEHKDVIIPDDRNPFSENFKVVCKAYPDGIPMDKYIRFKHEEDFDGVCINGYCFVEKK